MPLKNTTALDELLAAPVRSIGHAQQALENSNIHQLLSLMETDSDGSYKPRAINFNLSTPGGELRQVSIPLIALITIPQMLIDDVDISLNAGVRYSLTADKKPGKKSAANANDSSPATTLLCALLPEKVKPGRQQEPSLKVSLKVQRSSPSEAIRQLQDRFLEAAGRE